MMNLMALDWMKFYRIQQTFFNLFKIKWFIINLNDYLTYIFFNLIVKVFEHL